MPLSGGQELSLRHLPDVSDIDASFSFQIPVPAREDYLLADDGDDDFFKGVNDVLATPVALSRPTQHEPLTLSQLTPRPSETHRSIHLRSPLPSLPSPSRNLSHKPRLNEETQDLPMLVKGVTSARPKAIKKPALRLLPNEGSPAGARLDSLRAEVDLLAEGLGTGTSTSKLAPPLQSRLRSPKGSKRQSIDKGEPQSLRKRRRKEVAVPGKQTVISGAITKARKHKSILPPSVITSTQSAFVSTSPSDSSAQPTHIPEPNGDLGDVTADTSMDSVALGGVAGRLLMYSEKLISSFGLSNANQFSGPGHDPEPPMPSHAPTEEISSAITGAGNEFSEDHNKSLTVSQLSPQKPTSLQEPKFPSAAAPMSPLRPSSKRPASAQAHLDQGRKKVRSVSSRAGNTSNSTVKEPLASLRARPSHQELRPEASGSGSRFKGTRAREETITKARPIRAKRKRLPPVTKPGDKIEAKTRSNPKTSTDAVPTDSRKLRQGTTVVGNSVEVQGKSSTGPSLHSEGSQIRFSATTSLSGEHVASRPASATRPTPFTFHSDARLEARWSKLDNEDSKKLSSSSQKERTQQLDNDKQHRQGVSIPDFRTIHAAQEAEFALRKENICPTVPLPMRFETDFRVKERQKFDERVREKEREREVEREQRRREREEQEEKEVRELRKRAVPKAHEVPEWYKEAPRRREREEKET